MGSDSHDSAIAPRFVGFEEKIHSPIGPVHPAAAICQNACAAETGLQIGEKLVKARRIDEAVSLQACSEPRQLSALTQTGHRDMHSQALIAQRGCEKFAIDLASQKDNGADAGKGWLKVCKNRLGPRASLRDGHGFECLFVGPDHPFRVNQALLGGQNVPWVGCLLRIGPRLSEPRGRVKVFRRCRLRTFRLHTRDQVKLGTRISERRYAGLSEPLTWRMPLSHGGKLF